MGHVHYTKGVRGFACTFPVSRILLDLDVMVAAKTLRRAGALTIAAATIAAFAACGGSGDAASDGTGSSTGASTVFVPGSALPQPPLPPGAGPHGPNPNPEPTGMPKDAAPPPKDATTTSDAPIDATGQ